MLFSGTALPALVLLLSCNLSQGLNVASFNIQVFGTTKYANSEVVDVLVRIVRRYDLVFIQEVRDVSETVIFNFLDDVNSAEGRVAFAMNVSERLGTTSSKEQYVYMYRLDAIRISEAFVISGFDSQFERPPYVAMVTAADGGSPLPSFMAIGAHIRPSLVQSELNSMVDVYEAAKQQLGTSLALLMGDFNADCSYLSNTRFRGLALTTDDRFTWLIDRDSTVAVSECSYDRFVAVGGFERYVRTNASVFLFDDEYSLASQFTPTVSDHYPIQVGLLSSSAAVAASLQGVPLWAGLAAAIFVTILHQFA